MNSTPVSGRGVHRVRGIVTVLRGCWSPWWLVPILVGTVMGLRTSGPLSDKDSFVHVLVGDDIWTRHRFTGDPSRVYGPHQGWVTTQWASEVVFAGLHHLFGWAGLTYFTLLCGLGLLGLLASVLRTSVGGSLSRTPVVWVVYALIGLAVATGVEERPNTISYLALLVVSRWAWRGLTVGEWPRWWVAVAFTGAWAQFHGYWVLVAVAITLAALLRAFDQRTVAGWKEPFLLALGTSLVGVLTPAGIYGLYAPMVFKASAAPYLNEWAPTTLTGSTAATLGAVLLVVVVFAWVRSDRRVSTGEVAWVLVWALFAASAYRNVIPALLLVAPFAAVAVASAWPRVGTRVRGTGLTKVVVVLTVIAAAGTVGVRLFTGDPLPDGTPTRIYAGLSDEPGQRRVLNVYDLGGQVEAFTGPQVRVAVDGRADMFGAHLRPLFDLYALKAGSADTFAAYAPTDVITRHDYALEQALPGWGWRVRTRDGVYTWWQKP